MSDGFVAAIFVLILGGLVYWVTRYFDFAHPEFWGILMISGTVSV